MTFVMALIVGSIAASALSDVAMEMTGKNMRAVSTMIGLMANAIDSALIKKVTDSMMSKITGTTGGKNES